MNNVLSMFDDLLISRITPTMFNEGEGFYTIDFMLSAADNNTTMTIMGCRKLHKGTAALTTQPIYVRLEKGVFTLLNTISRKYVFLSNVANVFRIDRFYDIPDDIKHL
jgi:hypothetical protein